jgi:hypothetical protein
MGLTGLIENPNNCGIDLITTDRKFGVELERHPKWSGNGEFVYPLLNILDRKVHYFKPEYPMNILYIIINNEYSRIAYIWKKTVQKYLTEDHFVKDFRCVVPGEGIRYDDIYRIPRKELMYAQLIRCHQSTTIT